MKKISILSLTLASISLFGLTSCKGNGESATSGSDSTAVNMPELKGDDQLNKALRFYAGISKEGINLNAADAKAWDQYSANIKRLVETTSKTRQQMDSIATADFKDFRDSTDYVFYPFSAADFIYANTLFPDADTYFLCGLEKAGTPISGDLKTSYAHYEAYRQALDIFFRKTYFVTKNMKEELDNEELDGVCPVITMLMAVGGVEVISVEQCNFDAEGNIVAADPSKADVLRIKFFKPGSKHEQTLLYVSGDIADGRSNPNLKKYLDRTLPQHRVSCFLKAASFLMTQDNFTDIRNYILDYSQAIVQDDSGVPFRYLKEKFNTTLYGAYVRPLPVFSDKCMQPDLEQEYKDRASVVHRLPFSIGYSTPSSWVVARRK